MLRSVSSWCLITTLSFLVHVFATQVPFASDHDGRQPAILDNGDVGDWNFDTAPNPNSTDHLVFETAHSLLQRWPNTRMRNGHAIVPGVIPKGTLFYHGTTHNVSPTSHEWFAIDPEHSYLLCGYSPTQECWQFTLATTRPLKVVYFDGSSAAKLPYGTLDTQDLLLWGETRGGDQEQDRKRIEDICKWGEEHGVDGFVRMQMDFEVMLCDPTSGVRMISSSNLVTRILRWPQEPFFHDMSTFEVMNAGSWHNLSPGETRVRLDLAGLVTFYDTQLAPSLVAVRAGQERWDYRVQKISSEDLSAAKARLEETLARPEGVSSGIDWATLFQVISDRYAQRLELTRYLLNVSATTSDDVLDLANKTQTQLRIMLVPYILCSTTPTDPSDDNRLDWAKPTFRLCATTHTYSMDSELPFMTASEELLYRAIRGTTREICRVITKMWATGVHAGIDPLLNAKEPEDRDVDKLISLRNAWAKDLKRLMTWLDWSRWVKCDPACGPEEACYLPTWPVGFPGQEKILHGRPMGRYDADDDSPRPKMPMPAESLGAEMSGSFHWPVTDEWIRPQPKCIRKVAPYGF